MAEAAYFDGIKKVARRIPRSSRKQVTGVLLELCGLIEDAGRKS